MTVIIGTSTSLWTGGAWCDLSEFSDPWITTTINASDTAFMIAIEKEAWYQDHLFLGSPQVKVYSVTESGGNRFTGVAPTETTSLRYTHNCTVHRPTFEQVEQGYMEPNELTCMFYLDLTASPAEVEPTEADYVEIVLSGETEEYKIVQLAFVSDSGRVRARLAPLSEQEAGARTGDI